MKIFLLLLVVLFAFGASTEAGVRKAGIRLKVKKSADQPEVTALIGGQVFAQFTAVEITGVKKGKVLLNNIRIEIYSDDKFGIGNTPTIGEFFKKVYLGANTSPGNSSAVERTIIASLDIVGSEGFVVDLSTKHSFGDNAKFTIVGIPRDEALYNYSSRTIGLAVVGVDASDTRAKKARVLGNFPIMGTEQLVNPNAWVGTVYVGKTDFYYDGSIYPAIYVWGTADVVVKKIAFRQFLGKDAKIIIQSNGVNKEYDCLVDEADNLTACNFYTGERELAVDDIESLSSGSEGIYLSAGSALYVYSPNNSSLLNHLVDLNDIVIVGAYMNYRYAPQADGEGKACFLAGTMVKMADGSQKPIEKIKIGDSIWTGIGEGKSDKVKRILRQNDPEWLAIVAGDQVVLTVPDQQFFVVAQEADGKPSPVNEIVYPATMIKVGDIIKNDKGELVTVTAVSRIIKNEVPTWDLVLRNRTFYYADGFKVHSVMDGRSDDQLSALDH